MKDKDPQVGDSKEVVVEKLQHFSDAIGNSEKHLKASVSCPLSSLSSSTRETAPGKRLLT